ncbi:hypothetical protein K490DRAFT_74932 [Saccharata proteae CBS 121410]|uniref:Protein PNS1 n=1 Tax=Saccharata proteae CBS 121410 TaxID=1314787 RepID=A0A9P4HTM3_9PEZI|nr:hypothetical protein K490DRAFT_74932 [Saccharata proteae CBS 121410]
MFSEYASKFLQQSQSRLVGGQGEHNNDTPPTNFRRTSRYNQSSAYLQRPGTMLPNPYHPASSQLSRFIGSRTAAQPAPLFLSATDDFREEDDGEEHERDVADFYALQKSRRQFGGSHLTESSDLDESGEHAAGATRKSDDGTEDEDRRPMGIGRGIRSSWRGSKTYGRGRDRQIQPIQETDGTDRSKRGTSESSAPSTKSKGKGRLVDVELESNVEKDSLDEFEDDLADDGSDPPAAIPFARPPGIHPPRNQLLRSTLPIPIETDEEALTGGPPPFDPDDDETETTVETAASPNNEKRHDPFWSLAYTICASAYVGTAFLVFIHTSAPDKKHPLGDTIYTTLHSSFHLLAVYTLVSAIVATSWLAILHYFARPLVNLMLIGVPIILTSFSIYPFVWSYKGSWHGARFQDRAMRWLSLLPALGVIFWCYMVYKGRRSLNSATQILELASRVLTANPALVGVGVMALAVNVFFSWIWVLIFARLFLEGHLGKLKGSIPFFFIDLSTWWLGAFYVVFYLWTIAIISGVQRCLNAAAVSQWYFHRSQRPSPSSQQVAQAAFAHATGPMLGSIALSTLLALLLRLPLIVLPRRAASLLAFAVSHLMPTSVVAITNPLTLTYASIQDIPLPVAAHGLAQLSFVSRSTPTSMLTPRSFSSPSGNEMVPYRLSKLLLHGTRFVMAVALGFGGWVTTARMLALNASNSAANGGGVGITIPYKGSLYAYVVGMVAAAIGWSVLGAMEGVLGGIMDSLIVCWGCEVGSQGSGGSRFCPEAGQLFGDAGRWERGERLK